MAILKPEDFLDKHVNVPCVLAGHGPSLEKDLEKIQHLQSKGELVRFSVNNWFHYFRLPPTYYTLCNDYWTVKFTQPIVKLAQNDPGGCPIKAVFYCDALDPIDLDFVRNNCPVDTVDYVPYDQRHHGGEACDPYDESCCPHAKLRDSIQQIVAKKVGHNELRTLYVSSIFMAYYFAVIMGCNPIYFAGVDLDWGVDGYAKNLRGTKWEGPNKSKPGCSNVVADLSPDAPSFDTIVKDSIKHVVDIAKAANIQVYNLNPNSWYGIMPHAELP